jgi:hypothetical protein
MTGQGNALQDDGRELGRYESMRPLTLSGDAVAAINRLAEHLRNESDLTLIVLKGHLLIERQMRDILRTHAAPSELAKIDRWSFSALTRLTRAYVRAETQPLDDLWDSIDMLNALRNELAHQLDSPKVAALTERLMKLSGAEDAVPDFQQDSLELRVKTTLSFLVGRLTSLQK